MGETVFHDRHGGWRADYRRYLAAVHDPVRGRYAAVAVSGDTIAGYVAWLVDTAERHGEIDMLAVAAASRGRQHGRRLAEHAIDAMKSAGAEVVTIGTGGDPFHAPARALYESLGFTPFPNVLYAKAVRA